MLSLLRLMCKMYFDVSVEDNLVKVINELWFVIFNFILKIGFMYHLDKSRYDLNAYAYFSLKVPYISVRLTTGKIEITKEQKKEFFLNGNEVAFRFCVIKNKSLI